MIAAAASGPSAGLPGMLASSTCMHVRRQAGHLGGEHFAERHRQLVEIAVVLVEQRAREHVGARDGELERAARDRRGALAVGEQIERAFAERAVDDARGLAAEAHRLSGAKTHP